MQAGLPKALNFRGQSRCLAHLAAFTHRLEGYGPNNEALVIRVTFESHVFSKSEGLGSHDFLDESGNRRFFCPDRYDFSFTLPDDVRRILDQNVYMWEVKDKNQVANLAVLSPASLQMVSGTHNVLVYYLYQSGVAGIHVEMRVKSCYRRTIDFGRYKKREKIRVFVRTVCFKGGRVPKA